MLEQPTSQTSKDERQYWSFWVRLNFGPFFVSMAGWKYFPDNGTLSTPSQLKSDKRFFNTVKTNPEFYNLVREKAEAAFGRSEVAA